MLPSPALRGGRQLPRPHVPTRVRRDAARSGFLGGGAGGRATLGGGKLIRVQESSPRGWERLDLHKAHLHNAPRKLCSQKAAGLAGRERGREAPEAQAAKGGGPGRGRGAPRLHPLCVPSTAHPRAASPRPPAHPARHHPAFPSGDAPAAPGAVFSPTQELSVALSCRGPALS